MQFESVFLVECDNRCHVVLTMPIKYVNKGPADKLKLHCLWMLNRPFLMMYVVYLYIGVRERVVGAKKTDGGRGGGTHWLEQGRNR